MFAARYWSGRYQSRRYWPAVGAAAPASEYGLVSGVMGGVLLMSSAAQPLLFHLTNELDHASPLTGLTPTVTLSKNGGSFASPAGAVTEIGSGWYKVAGDATDTNTLGPLVLHATATGADPYDEKYLVIAVDLADATDLGLSALDAAISTRASATNLATVAGYVDTEVAAILAAVDTEVAAIKAKTDLIPSSPAAVADIPTANANADALLDRANGVETGLTLRQALRLTAASLWGKLSGAATATVVLRNPADSKDRIVATVDASGNRSAVTTDVT